MLPVARKTSAVTISHASPGREPSQATDVPAICSQRHITQLPPEVLTHIFGCLGCDAIVQVRDTCRLFRKVAQADHVEALFYCQLPEQFRKQYPQSRSWQKWTVKSGLHPFTTKLPSKESRIISTEQHAALLCFHTLGKMMFTCRYRPVRVFASTCWTLHLLVDCSLNSSNLLLHGTLDGRLRVLGQKEAGSWTDQVEDLRGPKLLTGMSFNNDGRHLSFTASRNVLEVLKRDADHNRWQLINQQWVKAENYHKISPSGKYVAIYNFTGGLEGIRCLDDQGQWALMPMTKEAKTNSRISSLRLSPPESGVLSLQFSPSEQHLTVKYWKKLIILSLDSRGCWNCSWATTSDMPIDYIRFGPSDHRLLIAYYVLEPEESGSVEMIRHDPEWKSICRQIISSTYYRLTFSPSGNYLLSSERSKNYLLWQLLKSGEWKFYGDLTNPGVAPLPALEQTGMSLDIIKFSSCDNYLLTSFKDGAVTIWGQDEQESWVIRGREQHDGAVKSVKFSESGIHALTVDRSSIHIWGLDNDGLWSVKGKIPGTDVSCANFHPVTEHLVVIPKGRGIEIWEMRKGNSRPEVSRDASYDGH